MSRKIGARRLARASSALALLLAFGPACFAQQASLGQPCCTPQPCGPSCSIWCCPPSYKYCVEGPPNICLSCGCPKPVCCPCDLPNWGYFQTCWRPSPWGPNCSYCYGPTPPAAAVPAAGWSSQPADAAGW